jgi:tetratricopeptide (TPR) repeat protein
MDACGKDGVQIMTGEQFLHLVERGECDTVDLKREVHDVKSPGGKLAFLKDVTCLANTPREASAYILFGVDRDGALIGLSGQVDDAKFVDIIGNGSLSPVPTVAYHAVQIEGRQFGVLEILPERHGPVMPSKQLGEGFEPGRVWLRRSSKNVPAGNAELARCMKWFMGGAWSPEDRFSDAWQLFLDATGSFAGDRALVLIAEPLRDANPKLIAGLGFAPWNAVLDLDHDSERSGLLSAAFAPLESHRSLLRVVLGDRPEIHKRIGTLWFFVRGTSRLPSTLAIKDDREWLRKYGREIDDQMTALSRAISPSVVTCVILWSGHALMRELRTSLDSVEKAFGDQAEFVFITSDAKSVTSLSNEHSGRVIEMTPENLGSGLLDYFGSHLSTAAERCAIPTRAGAPHPLDVRDCLWLEEELEIVHLDIAAKGEDTPDVYRKGAPVTWRNLSLHHDCEREVGHRVRRRIEEDLRARRTTRVNLVHAPGAGGTTLAKRILWDLHREFPCFVLHKLSPEHTAARLTKLAGLTGHSLCLLVDGSEHQQSEVDALFDLVKSQQVPVVIFQSLRQFAMTSAPEDKQRTFHLKQQLDPVELDRFVAAYAAAVPSRSTALRALTTSLDPRMHRAFYVGLTAYGREFRGLPNYVQQRIAGLKPAQRAILEYLSLAHYYGQQTVPEQAFVEVLGIVRSRKVRLDQYLSDATRELLIQETNGEWRTAHEMVAEELLVQLLSPGQPARRDLWRQSLSAAAIRFAHSLRGEWQTVGERLTEIAQRVFVFRDSASLLGTESAATTKFSRLLEDIPTPEGRLEILRTLSQVFPDEPHFHAHLGRYCGLTGRFDDAIEAIERAIRLNERDPVLHHMRGMIHRYKARSLMESDRGTGLDQVVKEVQLASEAFAQSRELDPENEHAFVSEIQVILLLLDHAARSSRQAIEVFVYSPSAHPYLRECLERAEDLMDQLEDHRRGETRSNLEIDCRARLDAMYGDFSSARQGWDNLLVRPDVVKLPVRRQIVWSMLRQAEGDWEALEPKRIRRCVELLEENLMDEPDDKTSIRLWLRAVRHMTHPPTVDGVIEKVTHWRANSGALDASFYLFVLHAIRALDGSHMAVADTERALEECRTLARYRRDRTRSFEWFGTGEGVARLKHQSELGEWDQGSSFYPRTDLLVRVCGLVRRIDAPQKGTIETDTGLQVFFVPAVASMEMGRDENTGVSFYLGFSYDGLRAWDVQSVKARSGGGH